MTTIGLIAIAAGSLILSLIPATLGIPSYITPIVVITVGYALFQTANNTAVMAFRTPPALPSGEWPDCPSLRALREHILIVRPQRARRIVWLPHLFF
jgi:hypothetical protein